MQLEQASGLGSSHKIDFAKKVAVSNRGVPGLPTNKYA
jgi:hypothetical protein